MTKPLVGCYESSTLQIKRKEIVLIPDNQIVWPALDYYNYFYDFQS
jgi:hypothetical protein